MNGKVWSAEELDQMTPAEQDGVFASSVVYDLNDVPAAFLARVRARLDDRITKGHTPHSS